jgi:hypothetical protein
MRNEASQTARCRGDWPASAPSTSRNAASTTLVVAGRGRAASCRLLDDAPARPGQPTARGIRSADERETDLARPRASRAAESPTKAAQPAQQHGGELNPTRTTARDGRRGMLSAIRQADDDYAGDREGSSNPQARARKRCSSPAPRQQPPRAHRPLERFDAQRVIIARRSR